MYFMKKIFVSLLAVLMLCTGLSQFAFATEPVDPDNQPPTEQTGEGQDEKPSQPPKNGGENGKPVPCDCIDDPAGDCD